MLVNFWASWCVPCRQEAPALEEFQRRHGGRGFTVLGIDSRDLSGDGRDFVRRYGLSYPQLRDGDGATAHDFGTTGVPENFLVDPRGKVRLLLRGPVDRRIPATTTWRRCCRAAQLVRRAAALAALLAALLALLAAPAPARRRRRRRPR